MPMRNRVSIIKRILQRECSVTRNSSDVTKTRSSYLISRIFNVWVCMSYSCTKEVPCVLFYHQIHGTNSGEWFPDYNRHINTTLHKQPCVGTCVTRPIHSFNTIVVKFRHGSRFALAQPLIKYQQIIPINVICLGWHGLCSQIIW